MARIENSIRQKRFMVREGAEVTLTVETQSGARFDLRVSDASVGGLAATIPASTPGLDLEVDQILPESKLFWGEQNAALGKLFIRRVLNQEDLVVVAFTCIDCRVPLMSNLSTCFTELSSGAESPLDFELGSKKFNLASFAESEFQHPDLFEKCRQFQFYINDLRKNPLFQYYSIKQSSQGSRAKYKVSGSSKRIDCVSFASYDYLGFSQHPEVIASAKDAIDRFGVSAAGTMVLAGKTSLHEELEAKIADFFEREDALLYTTGFATNVGLVTGLVRANDLIVADIYSHASLHDGIAASRAKARFFKHNSISNLKNILEEHRAQSQGCLVITEGLFSMEGTAPDLRQLINVSKEHNARTFIDECHSIGVIGENGRGVSEREGVLDEIDIYMGSFSKGLGAGGGGFITGKKEIIEWLRFFSRPGMFSAALPPAVVGASIKIIELIQRLPERRQRLHENIKRFHKGLKKLGLKTDADVESPIVPVVIGDQELMGKMNAVLIQEGIFVNCILFPAVPVNSSRFRFSITAMHSDSDIDLAINALGKAMEQTAFTSKHLKKAS